MTSRNSQPMISAKTGLMGDLWFGGCPPAQPVPSVGPPVGDSGQHGSARFQRSLLDEQRGAGEGLAGLPHAIGQ